MKTARTIGIGARGNSAEFHSEARNLVAPSLAPAFAVCVASTLNAKGSLLSWNHRAPRAVAQEVNVNAASLTTNPTRKVSQQKENQL
jgi:hypothetical protein